MRKLMAVLALSVILYSCSEQENPDQLKIDEDNFNWSASGTNDKDVIQIPSKPPIGYSENALIQASYTPISDVSGNYTRETTLLDISGVPCLKELNSVANAELTLGFDKSVSKRQAGVCGWYSFWGTFPDVEGPNPHIVYTTGQRSIAISLSTPVTTFGFELQPNSISGQFQADFYREGNLIGSVVRSASSSKPPAVVGKASLFAAKTDASFDYILIQSINPFSSFSLGQFRYTLAETNPFTVDVKPGTCENSLNVKSNGVIPVGILASMDLDVKKIDLSTVRLNGVAPKMSSIADLGGFYEKEEACDCDPTDFNGIMDLDLKFDTQKIVATIGKVSDGEKVTVSLTFDTIDGKSWTGEDCIRVIKKGKK